MRFSSCCLQVKVDFLTFYPWRHLQKWARDLCTPGPGQIVRRLVLASSDSAGQTDTYWKDGAACVLVQTWGGWCSRSLPLSRRCMTVRGSEASSSRYGILRISADETRGRAKMADTNGDGWDGQRDGERRRGKITSRGRTIPLCRQQTCGKIAG